MFFQEEVIFLFKCGKAIFQQSRRLKSQNFLLSVNHGHDTDFSKLVNLYPVKNFPLILTPGNSQKITLPNHS